MTDHLHIGDEVQDLLDGRLGAAERERVEALVDSCPECRSRRDAILAVKSAARRALGAEKLPAGVSISIASALDRVVAEPARRPAWPLAAAAAAIFAALVAVFVLRSEDIPSAAAKDFARVREGELSLQLRTGDAGGLERFFSEQRVPFQTRVFDLGMMRYGLEGGRLGTLGGRPSALFVYRGPDERLLVCQMYRGKIEALPRPTERFEHAGIAFLVYRRGASTQVFWQERDVTCVLVSDAPKEEVLALAYAKAMKV